MRILHVISEPSYGGIETWLLKLMEISQGGEFEHSVCFKGQLSGPLIEEFRRFSAKVHHCPMTYNLPLFVLRFAQIVRHGRFDIVHSHHNLHGGIVALGARLGGARILNSIHNSQPYRVSDAIHHSHLARFLVPAYYAASKILANLLTDDFAPVSAGVARARFGQYYENWPNVTTLYLGLPDPMAIPLGKEGIRQEFEIRNEEKIIVHVGSFTDQKNHAGILRVFKKLIDDNVRVKLLLIGDGCKLRKDAENLARDLKISEYVHFAGHRSNVVEILRECDIFFMPSFYEGLPLAMVEAMSCSLAIVASDVPGIDEAVIADESGILKPVQDAEGMADALKNLILDDKSRIRLGSGARQRFLQLFHFNIHKKNLAERYRRLIKT